jgi:hypothetical protein
MQAETVGPAINSHYGAMKDFNRKTGGGMRGLTFNFFKSEKRVLTGEMVFVKVISSAVQKCMIWIITDLPIRRGERRTGSLSSILLNKTTSI